MVYRVLILTKGCFNNNYLLINKAIDIFPRDSICGGNIASKGNSINLYKYQLKSKHVFITKTL